MEGRSAYVFTTLQVVAAATLLWFLISWAAPWNMQSWVGSVLVVVGVAFVGVARCQLGKSFSIRPKARELVAHGLCLKIRNPIYVFGNDHFRLDPGAAEAGFMGRSRCRSCYPDYPRPA